MSYQSITEALRARGRSAIRWCTPSMNPAVQQSLAPYETDASISFESFGLPMEPTGLFLNAFERAAQAFGAEQTLFSVNGTTWSNFVVIKALAKQIPNLRILASRNVHRSVVSACEDYGVRIMFLPTRMDDEFHTFLPNTPEDILEGIARTRPQVLLVTTPTYEGLAINLRELIQKAHALDPTLIIFVDEAWGAHVHFSPLLPESAMSAGADICVQSTHKQGGSLQQTGMIHWRGTRIDADILKDAYRTLGTSSPSYLLLSSLEAATAALAVNGEASLLQAIHVANQLSDAISSIPEFAIAVLREGAAGHIDRDPTKVIVDVSGSGMSGYEVARRLEADHGVVVEAYNLRTILFVVPFSASLKDVEATRSAFQAIATRPGEGLDHQLDLPETLPKVLDLTDVSRLLPDQLEDVPLSQAVGRICGEHITPFPPGIPITIKGEELTSELVAYYDQLGRIPNVHIVAMHPQLRTVRVVR